MKKLSNAGLNLPKVKQVWVFGAAVFALLFRLLFIFSGYEDLPGERGFFTNNDSFSYAQAFINWWELGIYSFDLTNEGAKYGRLPGYPTFWGLHYVLFGPEKVYVAVAVTQAFLDSLVCIMLYRIITAMNAGSGPAFVIAMFYAVNPFAIYWVPLTATESLGVFISILFLNVLVRMNHLRLYPVYIGLIGASAFYIREYLAVLMLSAVLYLYFSKQPHRWRNMILAAISFWMVAGMWQVRNYCESGDLIWVKKGGSGYHRYGADVSACRAYVFAWSPEFDYYMDEVFNPEGNYELPPEAVPSSRTAAEVKANISKAFECGSGFHFWHGKGVLEGEQCNSEVAENFRSYRSELFREDPLRTRLYVPAVNLTKAFFKRTTLEPKYPAVEQVLFGMRSTVIVLSFFGLFVSLCRREWRIVVLGALPVFMYYYIPVILRQVEMRYLLQADAVMLIFLGVFLSWPFKKLTRLRQRKYPQ